MPPFDPGKTIRVLLVSLRHLVFADIAQLGERQTEDLKVPGSIPGVGIWIFFLCWHFFIFASKYSGGNCNRSGSSVGRAWV